jgi:hypothetical protein
MHSGKLGADGKTSCCTRRGDGTRVHLVGVADSGGHLPNHNEAFEHVGGETAALAEAARVLKARRRARLISPNGTLGLRYFGVSMVVIATHD